MNDEIKAKLKAEISPMALIKTILKVILFFLIGINAFLGLASIWMLCNWSEYTIGEIFTYFFIFMNFKVAAGFVLCVIMPVVVIFVALYFIVRNTRKKYYKDKKTGRKKIRIICVTTWVLSVAFLLVAGGRYLYVFDTSSFVRVRKGNSILLDDNYVETKDVKLTFPEKKRNLIYIYLESMETSYEDKASGGCLDYNCMPELTKLAKDYDCFNGDGDKTNGAYVLSKSFWTMSAIFAQSSGVTMYSKLSPNETDKFHDTFYSNVTTIGDILEEQGYKQVVLMGSPGHFAGGDVFFKDHGGFDVHAYEYALEEGYIPEGYCEWYGYEDEKLFEFAKKELTELAASGEPFNYTMQTMDTHATDGYFCDKCKSDFEEQYENVIACSSRQLNDFVKWIQEQPFYENTTIVLSGDHLTMADYAQNLPPQSERRTYVCFINSVVKPANNERREYSTMDLFPTTLAAMGVKIEGNKLGLGTNLYSDEKTLIERYDPSLIDRELYFNSKVMDKIFYSEEEQKVLKLLEEDD